MGFLPFLVAYAFPLMTILGVHAGGIGFYLCPIVAFIVIPILDLMLGDDPRNPSPLQQQSLGAAFSYKLILWLFVPTQIALILWGAQMFCLSSTGLWEKLGLTLSVGIITGGIGITIAHELGHRTNLWERALSMTLLMSVCYGHWHREHISGHHAHVATPLDPATARYGQSFYAFFPQTLCGTFQSAFKLEKARALRRHHSSLFYNRIVWIIGGQLLIAALLLALWPKVVLLFFVGQSFIALTLLEIINYIEHYGLARKLGANGKYAKVTPAHSWNSCTRISNWLLFNLQRHSHHHMHPALRYPQLLHEKGSPQLPTGYAAMVIIALCPPLFRVLIHPRMIPAEIAA